MRHKMIIVGVGLLLLLAGSAAGTDTEDITNEYYLWIGGHLIDTTDYHKKVGEYRSFEEDLWPEFGFSYKSTTPNSMYFLKGHYFDKDNLSGLVSTTVSDFFKGRFQYRSLTRHTGQDLLENAEAREWLSGSPGGKMLTHEITDPDADYKYNRKEILSEVSTLLSRKNNVRLMASHRAILKSGTEQAIVSTHCFSCHLTSQTAKLEERTHDLQAGLDAEVGKLDVGYKFGYRLYESTAPTPVGYVDEAKHPVSGLKAAEFGSRLNYDNVTIPLDAKPKTQKMTHKVRVKGDAGKGKFASAVSYSRTVNKINDLASKGWAGTFNYAVPISPRTRLVARLSATGVSTDDPFVDVNTHREGKPSAASFDFTRYSSLDRTTADISAEVFHRLNPRTTLSFLAGYNRVARKDYPVVDDGITSNILIGQAKLRYRKGMKYSTSFKYRFEKTSDPFVSGRGLFEAHGSALDPIHYGYNPAGDSLWGYFYYLREELRYQAITTEPTDNHEVQLTATYRASSKTSLNLKIDGMTDKNGDLDSLDVKHHKANANLSLTFIPDPKWTFSGGFNYQMEKSRGPVTVALFDG